MPPRKLSDDPRTIIVSTYLRDQFWHMRRRLGMDDMACCVCEDALDCRKCFCLTTCGHTLCVSCLYQLPAPVRCPLCRYSP